MKYKICILCGIYTYRIFWKKEKSFNNWRGGTNIKTRKKNPTKQVAKVNISWDMSKCLSSLWICIERAILYSLQQVGLLNITSIHCNASFRPASDRIAHSLKRSWLLLDLLKGIGDAWTSCSRFEFYDALNISGYYILLRGSNFGLRFFYMP